MQQDTIKLIQIHLFCGLSIQGLMLVENIGRFLIVQGKSSLPQMFIIVAVSCEYTEVFSRFDRKKKDLSITLIGESLVFLGTTIGVCIKVTEIQRYT
ncbi:hypothetical protein QVD17_08179 [Tagetes erecta]|uniref:Uncharacterized protein n=1 Tax=Tagetes erecta TaxID=13708 RepID=A0AAD8P4F9_TARER|nr:hypothetical protein QVD17_08179 [Tagetes erecta]